ncbi:hypothetical protein RclHR1_06780002 [Rhizophagus clarus]|uniref:F-box domain-containing protein n=1 Tax=Rhizophagus clarus TaxID=94130 RepID=A0A2Z6RTC0_9GLOM|nr:hypothetical protein RclHR1_06780002 [Rhizophagus clarus]GET04919.1 hypothetical protein GLOIN_2v1764020 [Rhizophagus clarus]
MSKLSKDILFLIFEELQDDSKSFFSCLIVNRFWCETVIPILWKNPWCYNINYKNKNYLFSTIAFYLSADDIKEFLTRHGTQLPSVSSKSLSFDYLSFCSSINIDIINDIISIGSSLAYNQFLLQQEFYKLFMKKCPRLKYLDINSINHQIFYFPEANIRLESLCELQCNTSIDPLYFYGLARFCQHIQRLITVNVSSKSNHGIAKLIEVQRNLKYFEWNDDFEDIDYYTDDPYKEILIELEKKTNTLNHLKVFFQYVDNYEHTLQLLQEVLVKLHRLKTLTSDFSIFGEQDIKLFFFKELEILDVEYITIYEASIMIGNSGGQLKEISLKPYDFVYYSDNFIEDSLIYIRKIYENCPLIEYLSLVFTPSKDHFIEFEKLLNVCQNLKSLLLIVPKYYKRETEEKILESGKEILELLIKSASTNLREFRFFNDFKFSCKTLEEFLEKWRGRPALTILTSNSIYEGEDYKKLINKYKDDGVIKNFSYESITNTENMDFKI